MSDNIPYEVQLEIIKKVSDVKSLIRFRSVSNRWKWFIDSPEFIAFYGTRDTQPHRLLLRYENNEDPRQFKYISFVDDVTFPQQQLDFAPNVPDLVKQYHDLTVIGSSCGLWCLHDYSSSKTEMVVIWNPSIRKSVGIVVPRVLKITKENITQFGFGVCPSTYDPTIVGISYSYEYFEKEDTRMWQVGVFALSSQTWKMIPTSSVFDDEVTSEFSNQVNIDRFIYWIVANDYGSNTKNLILSFDLITYEFKEIHLPVRITNQDIKEISISELNESLIVSAYTNGDVYGVWMMGDDGGVKTSFKKLFNIKIPDSSTTMTLLGFRKSGQPIMETIEEEEFGALTVYEPCSKHISNIGIYGVCDSLFICQYKETLLLADHSDGCIISIDY